jgi:hypothetical protein
MGRTASWSVDLWTPAAGGSYAAAGSPRLSPGQVIRAGINNELQDASGLLWLDFIRPDGTIGRLNYELTQVEEKSSLEWLPDLPADSAPLALGLEILPKPSRMSHGHVAIHFLDWSGEPTLDLPAGPAIEMRQQWVDATDQEAEWWGDAIACVQNRGRGMLLHGQQAWRDIRLSAEASCDHGRAFGLAIRVMGLRRYVAIEFDGSEARIVRRRDDEVATLGAWPFAWPAGSRKHIWIEAQGDIIRAGADGELWEAMALEAPQGCIALWAEEGAAQFRTVRVRPSDSPRQA